MGTLTGAPVEYWHQRLFVDNVHSLAKTIQRRKRNRERLGIWLNIRAFEDCSALDHAVEFWRDVVSEDLAMHVSFCEPPMADMAVVTGVVGEIETNLFQATQDDVVLHSGVDPTVAFLAEWLVAIVHYHNSVVADERDKVHVYTYQL